MICFRLRYKNEKYVVMPYLHNKDHFKEKSLYLICKCKKKKIAEIILEQQHKA